MSIGFRKWPNPAHLEQHHLWRLSKPDGRTCSACLRQVPHGIELVIFFKGELLWSEVLKDSREAGALADETGTLWEEKGWSADA